MPLGQQIFALILSAVVFLTVIDLVRRRRLREEYSVLWLVTSSGMFLLVLRYEWLAAFTVSIGAERPSTTLFVCAIVFLMLLSVQFCIKISRLTDQLKNLSQEHALLRRQLEAAGQDAPSAHAACEREAPTAGERKDGLKSSCRGEVGTCNYLGR